MAPWIAGWRFACTEMWRNGCDYSPVVEFGSLRGTARISGTHEFHKKLPKLRTWVVGSRSGAVFRRSSIPGAPRFLWDWTH